MAATVDPLVKGAELEIGKLRSEIVNYSSSWAALCLCVKVRPVSFDELVHAVGVAELTGGPQRRAFNACADGWAVFTDGRLRCRV